MSDLKKVVFFFPWKEVSGGPYYLADLANHLADDPQYEVWYTDYNDTFVNEMVDYTKIKKITYKEPFDFPLIEPVILIVPIYCASHIPRLPAGSKILFVNWHNFSIQALKDIWRLTDKELQKFLRLVYETDSVFFLDKSHWDAQNEWITPNEEYRFKEKYVPVTIEKKGKCILKKPQADLPLRIAVLGRLTPDKTNGVFNMIKQLNNLANNVRIELNLIGDGEEHEKLLDLNLKSNFAVHLLGTITGKELHEYLANEVDVLFAMGRSALEGATVGLPTVIMPHNVVPFERDAYVYIQDTSGYALGWYDTQMDNMNLQIYTMNEIVNDIQSYDKKLQLGEAAYKYVEKFHLQNISALKEAILETALDYDEFEKFANNKGKFRIFGIPIGRLETSFDEKVKTISAFGVKNFVQYENTEQGKNLYLLGRKQTFLSAKKEDNIYRVYLGKIRIPFIHV